MPHVRLGCREKWSAVVPQMTVSNDGDITPPGRFARSNRPGGFTLIELLVVVAIIMILMAILLPVHRYARTKARIVLAHADLRQICTALDAYSMDNGDTYPPTRSACGTDVNNQLPVELANDHYLPRSPSNIPQAEFMDVFRPEQTYKYRAPGAIWFNGSFMDFPDSTWRLRSKIWVPDDFPHCTEQEGQYYADRTFEESPPVAYAIWSIGPDPESPKFPRLMGSDEVDTARFPLPKAFWLQDAGDTGLITHFRSSDGHSFASP